MLNMLPIMNNKCFGTLNQVNVVATSGVPKPFVTLVKQVHHEHGCWNTGSPVSLSVSRKRRYRDISATTTIEAERTCVPDATSPTNVHVEGFEARVSISMPSSQAPVQLPLLTGRYRTNMLFNIPLPHHASCIGIAK